MHINHNISLKPYNTFGIDALAKHFLTINSIDELKQALSLENYPDIFVLGGGSNMLLTKNLEALVLHLNIKGISIISEDEDFAIVQANAGENWHEFVQWCLEKDFGGLENLSLIPGNVGSAPIQNIGAYGIELKDAFVSCQALDIKTKILKTYTREDCKFDYRNSIFKQEEKGKVIICNVTFKLSKKNHTLHTSYGSIPNQLAEMNITHPTIQDVSKAVIQIRQSKLPDPKKIGNSGSFFKNPVISLERYSKLKENFKDIPGYPVAENEIKVPAGWLIEKAGFKGKQFGDYGVHKEQALVLVNYGNATGQEILDLSKLIQKTIKHLFNIHMEAEVNIL